MFWNGSLYVAVGTGTYTIASSPDGIIWTGRATATIFNEGKDIGYYPTTGVWISVGNRGTGTHTIATSPDGTTWTGINSTIFTTSCNGIAWNGSNLLVAVGEGTNRIATSPDGSTWTGRTTTIFTTCGNGICWTGTNWIAVGEGTNTVAFSTDGIVWTGNGTTLFTTSGNGIAGNPRIGSVVVNSQITLNEYDVSGTNKLDVVADSYFNTGFTNMSVSIKSFAN
jgi:hypothetical protein